MKKGKTKSLNSKSKCYIEETIAELKQERKDRQKIIEKLQTGLKILANGMQQLRYSGEEMKVYGESLVKNEESFVLGNWYLKTGVLLKRLSDVHMNMNNAITSNLVNPFQQFLSKDLPDAKGNVKKFDRSWLAHNEAKQKLENLKKKEKNPAKITEVENEVSGLEQTKKSTKQATFNSLKEISEHNYYSNLEGLWESLMSFHTFFEEAFTLTKKLASDVTSEKEKLPEYREKRLLALQNKMENIKEKHNKQQLRESNDKREVNSAPSIPGKKKSMDRGPDRLPGLSPRGDFMEEHSPKLTHSQNSETGSDTEGRPTPFQPTSSPMMMNLEVPVSNDKGVVSPRLKKTKYRSPKLLNNKQPVDFLKNLAECTDPARSLLLRFIYSETKYYEALSTLVKSYYEPFIVEFKDKHEERDIFFCNILDIYNHQCSVLEALNGCKNTWPKVPLLDALLTNLQGMRVYVPYMINYGAQLKNIEKLAKNKPFQSFLSNVNTQCGMTFLSLLEYPTTATATLKLQLELMIKNNLLNLDDVEKTENAFNVLEKISEEIEVKKLNKVNISKILLLQDRLINFEGRLDDNIDRIIIHEGSVIMTTEATCSEIETDFSKSKYFLFLFTDIVLITKKSIKLITHGNRVIRDKKYKVVHNFSLLDATLNELVDNESSFVLTISGMSDEEQVIHTITLPSKDLKLLWVEKFQKQIEIANSKRIFGRSIDEVVKKENSVVPMVIDSTVKHIISHGGLQVEGLIRVTGNAQLVKSLKRKIDTGGKINLEKIDPHSVCGLLKSYLRALPVPIMENSYDKLVEHIENENEERIEVYRKVLQALPEPAKFSLQIIFSFFDLLASYSDVNKMHSRNIAIVMGPIMMLQKQSNQYLDMSKQNNAIEIVDFIITHYQTIFINIKQEKEKKMGPSKPHSREDDSERYIPEVIVSNQEVQPSPSSRKRKNSKSEPPPEEAKE